VKQIVTGIDEHVGDFMAHMLNVPHWTHDGRGIGVVDFRTDEMPQLIAGIWFENFNGANMMMHAAALPGSRWMNKEVLWYTFHYAFVTCGCKRVTGLVPESNAEARRFDERLGFTIEARLRDAAPDGDLLVYVMFAEDCRWLQLVHKISSVRLGMH
jgi:RimJ/RimL family protein N-acetyltransferase